MKSDSKIRLTYRQLKALIREAVEGDDQATKLDPETNLQWEYIVNVKGYDYLAKALLEKFYLKNPLECKRFLKDLFLSVHSDQEQGRIMRGEELD